MKKFFGVLTWITLAVLMYGAADIAERAHYLNRLWYRLTSCQGSLLGYAFVILVFGLAFLLIIKPLWEFRRFLQMSEADEVSRAKGLLRRLAAQEHKLSKEAYSAYAELDEVIKRERWDLLSTHVEACQAYDVLPKEVDKTITSHARTAALLVVLSRMPIVDGLCLLGVQMKLVLSLARLYGYRTGLIFNICCFGWMVVNSVAAAMLNAPVVDFSDIDFADGAADATLEVGAQFGKMILGRAVEAVNAGTAVYVTGKIFESKMNGAWERPTIKSILSLRREGKTWILKNVFEKLFSGKVGNE